MKKDSGRKPKEKKRLRAKVTVGHDADRKPIVKYAQGYSKKELSANTEELRRTYINGAVAVRRDVLFGEFTIDWFNAYKKGKVRPSTEYKYKILLNNRLLPAFGERQMRAITAIELQRYMDELSGECRTLIGNVSSVFHNVFSMAYAQGIVDRDPAVALKKPSAPAKSTRRALTDDETAAVKKLFGTSADGLLLAVLYYTGMRRGEALGLRWSDIDFEKKWLHVQREIDPRTDQPGELKTKNSDRYIPIPAELIKLLRAARKVGTSSVIETRTGSYWHATAFNKHWKEIAAQLLTASPGIEATEVLVVKYTREKKRVETHIMGSVLTPHYFRHNYASILYNAGVDVMTAQKYLGHADPSTTMRIYTHLSDAREASDIERIDGAFSGNFLATSKSKVHENEQNEKLK